MHLQFSASQHQMRLWVPVQHASRSGPKTEPRMSLELGKESAGSFNFKNNGDLNSEKELSL